MKNLFLLLSLFVFTTAQAQQSSISGKVIDGENKAVGYANVLLLKAADSSLVKGALSEDAGTFLFEGIAAGKYKVVASMVGQGKASSAVFTVNGTAETIKLEPILLKQAATNLKEVVVEGQRPLIEQQFDKTVMNVENSIVAAGNTALDVLEKAPGIVVDQNDNISMRGRQGVMVMIDGKQVPMSGTELANYLKGLSANSLDKIELITNPSSKYDAAGNAGIINIKLKRDKSLGTNGTFSTSFGQGRYSKGDASLQLNHRAKKLNVFGGLNYANRKNFSELDFVRNFINSGEKTGGYEQQNVFDFTVKNYSGRFGVDYFASPKTVMGVVATGSIFSIDRSNTNKSLFFDAQRNPLRRALTDADVLHERDNQSINFNLKHTLDSLGREVTADLDYITFQNGDLQDFTIRSLTVSSEPVGNPVLLHSNLDGNLTIKSAKVDYVQPLPALDAKLEAGIKSSLVNSDNDQKFYDRTDGRNDLLNDRSNRFLYEENINAAYLNTNKKWEKVSLQLGLRLENTIAKGEQLAEVVNEDDREFDRNYTQFFPSAFVGYNLSKKHELGVSLSRRINRPSYNQLNPFKNLIDAFTVSAGNPYLKPELSYSFEVTHTFDKRFTTKLSYSHTSDVMVQVLSRESEDDNVVIQTFRNLAKLDYFGLTATMPFSVGNWLNSMNNATVYYGKYSGQLGTTTLNAGMPTFNFNSNNTVSLSNTWKAEVIGTYRTSEVYGFLEIDPVWSMAVGVQKQLWDKKATLKLNVSDIFYTNKIHGVTQMADYTETFDQRRDSRVATISFNYRFGGSQVAPARRRTSGAEEEKNRAN
ncbi:outer membrane beta-barrel family protein [Pontibacter cellulosilyticus]|uniref:TonB-dependent receptor n=1 Tax=Pontibacter cellulosilyticus TaxID=1720253 RepID=A0A923SH63_9BACT|nr:outer membrane beta-barrel family protein [Pontibacter cellulosilyticus]MBC5991404.1 TonB-dependent receptor [Pontibacter cellulosilyticus]